MIHPGYSWAVTDDGESGGLGVGRSAPEVFTSGASVQMSKFVKSRVSAVIAALSVMLVSPAFAAWRLNMTEGVTDLSRQAYSLHMRILLICTIIAVVVFGAMIYSIVRFRHSKGAVPDTTLLHSTKVEIIWTAVPILILIFMAIPAARALIKIEDTRGSEMTIKVTGYQWKWEYSYLDQNVDFFSTLARDSNAARQLGSNIDPNTVQDYLLNVDNPLVVPVNTKVRILLTAGDVIHAWWVPAFGMKKDAIPGFVNEMWFKADQIGTYRGQCAELCGRDHGFMPVVVEVKSKDDYAAWLKSKQPAAAADASSSSAATTAAPATT
jgi:cytochrome c oxidase subunit II